MAILNKKNPKLEKEIDGLIKKIYRDKNHPYKSDFLISEEKAREIYENLKIIYETNFEFRIYPDYDYCYYILISESNNVPLIPNFKKGVNNRKEWIKKYGKNHYQMYVVISKLGPYAFIYWSKYRQFLSTESQKIVYKCPSANWRNLYNKISSELEKFQIKLLPLRTLNKVYDIQYNGLTYIDSSPPVLKLLFTEELR